MLKLHRIHVPVPSQLGDPTIYTETNEPPSHPIPSYRHAQMYGSFPSHCTVRQPSRCPLIPSQPLRPGPLGTQNSFLRGLSNLFLMTFSATQSPYCPHPSPPLVKPYPFPQPSLKISSPSFFPCPLAPFLPFLLPTSEDLSPPPPPPPPPPPCSLPERRDKRVPHMYRSRKL